MGAKLGNNEGFVALHDLLPDGIDLEVHVESLVTGPKKLIEVRAAGRLLHGTAWRDDETADRAAKRLKAALQRKGIV